MPLPGGSDRGKIARHFQGAARGGYGDMKHCSSLAAAAIGAALCAVPAPAQIATTGPAALARQMPTVYAPYMANISRVRVLQRRPGAAPSASNRQARQNAAARLPRPAPGAQGTAFRAAEPPFVPRQLAARLARAPQERRYIEGVLTECLTFYTDNARRQGVPLNDVARALNYFISTNYFVYSEGRGPTPRQMSATRDLVRANLVEDPAFRQMSDRQKQEAYETLIVLAAFVDRGYGTSRSAGNAEAAEQFRAMARHNLEALLGVSVDRINFTDGGLELD